LPRGQLPDATADAIAVPGVTTVHGFITATFLHVASGLRFVAERLRWPQASVSAGQASVPPDTRVRRLAALPRIRQRGLAGAFAIAILLIFCVSAFASESPPLSPKRLAGDVGPALGRAGIVALVQDAIGETQDSLDLLFQDIASAVRPLVPGGSAAEARARAARAYRNAFGHDMAVDLPQYRSEVDAWVRTWQLAYNAGEEWAWVLLYNPTPR
jgi:hypothetical protein